MIDIHVTAFCNLILTPISHPLIILNMKTVELVSD